MLGSLVFGCTPTDESSERGRVDETDVTAMAGMNRSADEPTGGKQDEIGVREDAPTAAFPQGLGGQSSSSGGAASEPPGEASPTAGQTGIMDGPLGGARPGRGGHGADGAEMIGGGSIDEDETGTEPARMANAPEAGAPSAGSRTRAEHGGRNEGSPVSAGGALAAGEPAGGTPTSGAHHGGGPAMSGQPSVPNSNHGPADNEIAGGEPADNELVDDGPVAGLPVGGMLTDEPRAGGDMAGGDMAGGDMAGGAPAGGAPNAMNLCRQIKTISGPNLFPPAGIRVGFRVMDCDGQAVPRLTDDEFDIINDDSGEPFGAMNGGDGAVHIAGPTAFDLYTVLALDLSDSVFEKNALAAMIEAARGFVTHRVTNQPDGLKHNIMLMAFGRTAAIETIQDFTQDDVLLNGALDQLADSGPRGSRDLYNTYLRALDYANDAGDDGALVDRYVVLVTDGPHRAGDADNLQRQAQAAKQTSLATMYTVVLDSAMDDAQLEALATRPRHFITAAHSGELVGTLESVANDIEALAASNYGLGICTPVSLGQPSFSIQIEVDGTTAEKTVPYQVEGLTGDLGRCDPILISNGYERICVANTRRCVGNVIVDCDAWGADAERTDCTTRPGVCLNAQCVDTECGDGRHDPTEECDDGNRTDDDACTNACTTPRCGDQIKNADEQCDDGNDIDTDDCTNDCTDARCGDGVTYEDVEACDDGNDVTTDGCIECQLARCGDGFVQADVEACDDGNRIDTDRCTNACENARCGDGIRGPDEACDDGPNPDPDTCTSDCRLPDVDPPMFNSPLADVTLAVPADDGNCAVAYRIPEISVIDDRDPNPVVATSIVLPDGQQLAVEPGNVVSLGLGLYEVLVVATDRRGNGRNGSFNLHIVDQTPPRVANIPNPTPLARPAEAGTPVVVDYQCIDQCDPDPVEGEIGDRFAVGNTDVTLTCTDRSGNSSTATTTIRVTDTMPPVVPDSVPSDISIDCNTLDGATFEIPDIPWSDAGTPSDQLDRSLIVNPGQPDEAIYAEVPERLSLSRSALPHRLRFLATDNHGLTAAFDLDVVIEQNGAYRLAVSDLPDGGWFNSDAVLTVTAHALCPVGQPEQPDLQFEPEPDGVVRQGNTAILTYASDGLYALTINAVDPNGGPTATHDVAFGIDRTAPRIIMVNPQPAGGVANDPLNYPFFGKGEALALNVGVEDSGGGTSSGIRSVSVISAPGEFIQRTLANTRPEAIGQPLQGPREIGDIQCSTDGLINGNPLCTDGAINLRYLDSGVSTLRIVAEDFAGNTTSYDARYVIGDLGAAMIRAESRLDAVINPCETCPQLELPEKDNLTRAVQALTAGARVAQPSYVVSPFATPIFLGGAVMAAEQVIAELAAAIALADTPDRTLFYRSLADMISRAALTDLTLYHDWITTLQPAFGKELYIQNSYHADMARVAEQLTQIRVALAQRDWSTGLAATRTGIFFQKMAHQLWIMNWNAQPQPLNTFTVSRDNVNYAQYFQARDILWAIESELSIYLQTIENPPAELRVQTIRDLLGDLIENLDDILTDGVYEGLSDREYLRTMMDLRNIAMSSHEAALEGAFMQPYRYAMMLVVRWLWQFSIASARLYETRWGADEFALYQWAQQSIDEGATHAENGEIEQFINLYESEPKALCPIIGVYHCWYLVDERELPPFAGDNDQPLPDLALPDVCLDAADNGGLEMLLPSQWNNVFDGGDVPAACRLTPPN
ncbi:MAG: VWA domain-containing protein [Myxococcota bacterium]|nr:VWA domain-containing protein [Myxococcota bacterium]